jgi:hypothetical protein
MKKTKIKKCLVRDCTNTDDQGVFVGDFCQPCYMLDKTSQAYKNELETPSKFGLCHRCEHRVNFIEHKGIGCARPKYECGDLTITKGSCYMYMPVKPVILQVQKGDKRPLGGLIGARMEATKGQYILRDELEVTAIEIAKDKLAYIYDRKDQARIIRDEMRKENEKTKTKKNVTKKKSKVVKKS